MSRSGLSTSFRVPGATINVGKRGVRATVGIPGTGLSYSTNLTPAGGGRSPQLPSGASYWVPSAKPAIPSGVLPAGAMPPSVPSPYVGGPAMNEIGSAAVEWLTSPGLQDFKRMIEDARRQRREIKEDLAKAASELASGERELRWKGGILRFLFKKRVSELQQAMPNLRHEIADLNVWHKATHIEVQFDTGDQASRAYGALVRAYEACRSCSVIWDVTADRATNRVVERTTATRTVDRRPVRFEYDDSDLIVFQGKALRLTNANGDDLLVYPGMILVPRADGQFALVDLREVRLTSETVNFIEDERVPADARVVSHTWAKANKDGSPDRRFANNYQIPVCEYGRLHFGSKSGLNEEFQLSSSTAALAFGQAFAAYASALAARPADP